MSKTLEAVQIIFFSVLFMHFEQTNKIWKKKEEKSSRENYAFLFYTKAQLILRIKEREDVWVCTY